MLPPVFSSSAPLRWESSPNTHSMSMSLSISISTGRWAGGWGVVWGWRRARGLSVTRNFSTYGFDNNNSNDSLLAFCGFLLLHQHSVEKETRRSAISWYKFAEDNGPSLPSCSSLGGWGWFAAKQLVCLWRMRDFLLQRDWLKLIVNSGGYTDYYLLYIVLIAVPPRPPPHQPSESQCDGRHKKLKLYAPWANYLSTFMISVKTRFVSCLLPNELINYSHFYYFRSPISYLQVNGRLFAR